MHLSFLAVVKLTETLDYLVQTDLLSWISAVDLGLSPHLRPFGYLFETLGVIIDRDVARIVEYEVSSINLRLYVLVKSLGSG